MAFNPPAELRRREVTKLTVRSTQERQETMSQQQNASSVDHHARPSLPGARSPAVGGNRGRRSGVGPARRARPGRTHVIFHPFFTGLASTHRLIYVDLHGRGRSDQAADLTSITFADDVADVAELISELRLGPVHVYGFSYGGLLGQALALDHPDLVQSLVIANSLHSSEMWQANHANINAELARQHPDVWDQITALRAQGLKSTDPEVAAQFVGRREARALLQP